MRLEPQVIPLDIASSSPAAIRAALEAFASAVNRRLEAMAMANNLNEASAIISETGLPTAEIENLGRSVLVHVGGGTPDAAYQCVWDGAAYVWQAVVTGPPKLDDCLAPDDNTDLNASVSAHGLLRKLDGSTSVWLRGDGSWASLPAPGPPPSDDAEYVLLSLDGDLPNGVVLTAGSGITVTPGVGTVEIAATGGGGGLSHPQVMARAAWGL